MLKKTLLGSIVASTLLSTSALAITNLNDDGADRSPTNKPNVIVVFLDDAGYADISANNGKFKTPNIDKMAANGQNFSNFYVSSPVSSPSRAALLTSRLGTKTGMFGYEKAVMFEGSTSGFPASELTMPELFKDNGYKTTMLGKWHLGIGKSEKGLEFTPTRNGFDEWYGIPTSNDMFPTDPTLSADHMFELMDGRKFGELEELFINRDKIIADENGRGTKGAFNVPVYHNFANADGSFKDEQVGIMVQSDFTKDLTTRAVDYIEDNKDDPFFMYVAYPQNHVPLFVSSEFEGATETMYGNVMTEIDYSVGRIMDSLNEQGISDNTIVVFSSDNGPWLEYANRGASGSALPYREGKGSTYEGGVIVPGIIQWSGQIKPGVNNSIASTLDVMPTVAALAGIDMPDIDSDGFDLSDNILNGTKSPRTIMPYYYRGNLQAFRSGDYKIVLWKSGVGGTKKIKKKRIELYNLAEDPSEKKNLAKKNPEQVQQLIKEAMAYDKSLGEHSEPIFDL